MSIIETRDLFLRELTIDDYANVANILQDEVVMYAYEHAFSQKETQDFLDWQFRRYTKYGYGMWACTLKANSKVIGVCGLTLQGCENLPENSYVYFEDSEGLLAEVGRQIEIKVLEIGYLFAKEYWHKGYATQAAIGCKKYAFEVIGASEVYSIIRDTNVASQKVAIANGMVKISEFSKHYYNTDMPHFVYSIKDTKKV